MIPFSFSVSNGDPVSAKPMGTRGIFVQDAQKRLAIFGVVVWRFLLTSKGDSRYNF